MYSSQQTSALSIKSVLYSLFIHVVILNVFVFVIPLKKEPHKPKLVFFGGILQGDEFVDFNNQGANRSDLILKTDVKYKSSIEKAPYDNRDVSKPVHYDIAPKIEKVTEKIIEPTNNDDKPILKENKTDLPNIPPVENYQPLRFKSK